MKRKLMSLDNHSTEDLTKMRRWTWLFRHFNDNDDVDLTPERWRYKLEKLPAYTFAELGISKARLIRILEILQEEDVIR